jgi:serine/threonine-protein kinase
MANVSSAKLTTNVVPESLGRYDILGALARGGMATVYLGRHTAEAGFKRLYAIKVLHAHLADDASFVDMLLDEARIAARLHHPNVVPIVDLGSQDGNHFVVMEYIEGCSLSALLSKDRDARSPRLIVPIVLDALAGLHAAHSLTDDEGRSMQLVHRDVSPQNIVVGIDGTARITDFGIAKAASKVNSTQPGQLKGKLAYMAPEQLKNASNVDARTDVFAAGAMLWSALTGRKLFRGASDAETLNNILTLEVPKPSTIGFQPPAELDAICLKAMERDPAMRFQSMADMEDALRMAAERAGVLGSKREVAEWIVARFGDELAERRSVVRGSDVAGRTSVTSQVSGFRVIPPVGNASLTPSGAASAPQAALGEIAVDATEFQGPAKRTSRRNVALGVMGVALAVVIFGLGSRFRTPAAAEAPSATTSAPPSANVVAADRTATAIGTVSGTTTIAAAAATTPAPTATAATSVAAARPQPPATPPRVAAPFPASAPKSVVAAAPPAPAQPASTPKKKAWDSDSPLPPQ